MLKSPRLSFQEGKNETPCRCADVRCLCIRVRQYRIRAEARGCDQVSKRSNGSDWLELRPDGRQGLQGVPRQVQEQIKKAGARHEARVNSKALKLGFSLDPRALRLVPSA